MILLGSLTKIEKKKLLELKEEIVLGFRKRVTPLLYRADGSTQPIPRRSPMRMVTKMERRNYVIDDINRTRARLNQFRGITYIGFVESMVREYTVGVGIPPEMMEQMAASQERMGNGARSVSVNSVRRRIGLGPCQCPNCLLERGAISMSGIGNSTLRRTTLYLGEPGAVSEMMPEVQVAGPLRRLVRRYASIGGFGSIMETEPGKDRRYRSNGDDMLEYSFYQAERNREMQYDERDWEI